MASRFEAASARVSASEDCVQKVLADPAASYWLKDAIRSAMRRDLVGAAADAQLLFELLYNRNGAIIDQLAAAVVCDD